MKVNAKYWIVFSELIGFALVMLVVWLTELVDLPAVLLGASSGPIRLQEAWLETSAIIIACASVIFSTIWLFRRIKQLESYLIVCAWCGKVKVGERWITFEQYMSEKSDTMTSHGICEPCAEKQLREAQQRQAALANRG